MQQEHLVAAASHSHVEPQRVAPDLVARSASVREIVGIAAEDYHEPKLKASQEWLGRRPQPPTKD